MDGVMANQLAKLVPGESEKLTINLGVVDLGQIDLLVQEGFYANRSDLIRTAIRNQLSAHSDSIKASVVRRVLCLGLQEFNRDDLEASLAAGVRLQIRVVGLVRIASDVTPALANKAIESIEVLGTFQASPAVKQALAKKRAERGR
jgi:Arc/MetJ-type ribon-helix-helix transcriptional regulator